MDVASTVKQAVYEALSMLQEVELSLPFFHPLTCPLHYHLNFRVYLKKMTINKHIISSFIILHLFAIFALSSPLNSTILRLPQTRNTLQKSQTWPAGTLYDDVPSKEDITLLIQAQQSLPKHPAQLNQDAKDLYALIRTLQVVGKPDRSVSQSWSRRYHYVQANVKIKAEGFTEGGLLDVLKELYLLVTRYGPANLSIDVLLDDSVVALLTLGFEDGSIV